MEGKESAKHTGYTFLESGVSEFHVLGRKVREYKWRVLGGEVHSKNSDGRGVIHRINPDGSLTMIADIID